jgi:ribonuclease HII
MDSQAHSIAALRQLLQAAGSDAHTLQICAALDGDTRAGARALAHTARRRIETASAERARVAGLFALRGRLHAEGLRCVAGVDEVGVGPLAGPVVAAAVVLADQVDLPGLDDSKKLSAKKREALDAAIRTQALGIGIGQVEPGEIDRLNIHRASLEAMRRAVDALETSCPPDHLLVDARVVPNVRLPASRQTAIVHGDARDGSIAAASIVAKVHRDAIMRRLDERHPGYGFERHMGYGTAEHLDALRRLGATSEHRRSFAPVAAVAAPR